MTTTENNSPEVTPKVAERTTFVRPLANISETADGFVVEAELPGVSKEGLEVTVENGELVIVGRRNQPRPAGPPAAPGRAPADSKSTARRGRRTTAGSSNSIPRSTPRRSARTSTADFS